MHTNQHRIPQFVISKTHSPANLVPSLVSHLFEHLFSSTLHNSIRSAFTQSYYSVVPQNTCTLRKFELDIVLLLEISKTVGVLWIPLGGLLRVKKMKMCRKCGDLNRGKSGCWKNRVFIVTLDAPQHILEWAVVIFLQAMEGVAAILVLLLFYGCASFNNAYQL